MPSETATTFDPASQLGRVQKYWNARIHDLEMTSHEPGTREFFADLDEYRFDKLRYLPKLVDFSSYQGRRLLEVGCGIGTDLVRFAKGGAHTVGVDFSTTALDLAQKNTDARRSPSSFILPMEKISPSRTARSTSSMPTGSCSTQPIPARWSRSAEEFWLRTAKLFLWSITASLG